MNASRSIRSLQPGVARRRAAAAPIATVPSRGGTGVAEAVLPLGALVDRFTRSWEAAGYSVCTFLDRWSPLPIPLLAPPPARVARRAPRARRGLSSRRAARRPRSLRSAAWPTGASAAVDPALLRRRFPYVAELLEELAVMAPAERRGRHAGR